MFIDKALSNTQLKKDDVMLIIECYFKYSFDINRRRKIQ